MFLTTTMVTKERIKDGENVFSVFIFRKKKIRLILIKHLFFLFQCDTTYKHEFSF